MIPSWMNGQSLAAAQPKASVIPLVTVSCLLAVACGRLPGNGFRFQNYEQEGGAKADTARATEDFSKAFPRGTPLSNYDSYFRSIGGECWVVGREHPNNMLCDYDHGLMVASSWHCVITFDPVTKRSVSNGLTFGLTGL